MVTWINSTFPHLTGDNHEVTSKQNDAYNCIAWAAGFDSEWWSDIPGYKWPASERNGTIASLISVFENLEYLWCGMDASLEPGYRKVALYSKKGQWTHAAKQNTDGTWSSKLGPDEDIQHDTPEVICGHLYGKVHCFMKKRIEGDS